MLNFQARVNIVLSCFKISVIKNTYSFLAVVSSAFLKLFLQNLVPLVECFSIVFSDFFQFLWTRGFVVVAFKGLFLFSAV